MAVCAAGADDDKLVTEGATGSSFWNDDIGGDFAVAA